MRSLLEAEREGTADDFGRREMILRSPAMESEDAAPKELRNFLATGFYNDFAPSGAEPANAEFVRETE